MNRSFTFKYTVFYPNQCSTFKGKSKSENKHFNIWRFDILFAVNIKLIIWNGPDATVEDAHTNEYNHP